MPTALDTAWILDRAKRLGFDLCGVIRADNIPELERMEAWLARDYAGEMKYLRDPRRMNLQRVMPGTRSAIVCAINYNTSQPRSTEAVLDGDVAEPRGWVSRYAWGLDYHEVLQEHLELLSDELREKFPGPLEIRVYTDTGPLQERILAKYAGLGWLGKNTLLLNDKLGSWFFLGAILTTLELEPSVGPGEAPPPDLCGSCRRCLEACPTGALVEPYLMDARLWISYLTIELRGSIPEELRKPMGWHVFGCDICQDVCPWNKRAPITQMEQFYPGVAPREETARPHALPTAEEETDGHDSFYLPRLEWLAGMREEDFRRVFRHSPVKRAKWRGLVRNACIALGNCGLIRGTPSHVRIRGLLQRLQGSPEPLIAESARWALSRIE